MAVAPFSASAREDTLGRHPSPIALTPVHRQGRQSRVRGVGGDESAVVPPAAHLPAGQFRRSAAPYIPLNRATRSSIGGWVLNSLFAHPLCSVSGLMI